MRFPRPSRMQLKHQIFRSLSSQKTMFLPKWCLSELVKILDCKKMNGQIVIPVFYHVDPSDVRKQRGSFEEAFVEYGKNFPHKVQKWRDALTEASSLSGYDATESRTEAELVKEIAADIFKKLEDMSDSTDLDGFVGLNSRIEEVKSLLCLESRDVRIVGIWGMGGIGKTTIASAVFHQISRHFHGNCFMAKCQRRIKQNGSNSCSRRESLAGELDKFTTGSRIIITTRDKQVLDKCGVNYVYEVEGLEHNKAFELFYRKAFRQNNYPPDFLGLSLEVVHYARNNPLALEVLGSSLYQKSKQQWEDRLHNLRLISEPNIYKGTDNIEGIFLNLSKINDLHLSPQAFAKMSNLRLLKFYMPEHDGVPITSSKVHLDQGLEYLPEELRYLHWHEYPLKTLPFDFEPENLTELITINCGGCVNLTEFPQISGSVTELILWETAIKEVPSSVGCLTNLQVLSLSQCTRLKRISTSILKLKSLQNLYLIQCFDLENFPEILEKMEYLNYNALGRTKIRELPSTFEKGEGTETGDQREKTCGSYPDLLGHFESSLQTHIPCNLKSKLLWFPGRDKAILKCCSSEISFGLNHVNPLFC
ncbi:hypothetical protein WN943_015965 [Citrus x changshan-huyou]